MDQGLLSNIACLPSKNEIWSARVAHLAHHAAQFGTVTGPVTTNMATVREDPDVADEMQRLLSDEGIQFLVAAETLNVHGRSGEEVSLTVRTPFGEQKIEGSDILVAAGRVPNTARSGLRPCRRPSPHPRLERPRLKLWYAARKCRRSLAASFPTHPGRHS